MSRPRLAVLVGATVVVALALATWVVAVDNSVVRDGIGVAAILLGAVALAASVVVDRTTFGNRRSPLDLASVGLAVVVAAALLASGLTMIAIGVALAGAVAAVVWVRSRPASTAS